MGSGGRGPEGGRDRGSLKLVENRKLNDKTECKIMAKSQKASLIFDRRTIERDDVIGELPFSEASRLHLSALSFLSSLPELYLMFAGVAFDIKFPETSPYSRKHSLKVIS